MEYRGEPEKATRSIRGGLPIGVVVFTERRVNITDRGWAMCVGLGLNVAYGAPNRNPPPEK